MVPTTKPGLEGVIAAETQLSRVDGERGELILAGFPVEVLAPVARFEETMHLFLKGGLPSARQLDELRAILAELRQLDSATLDLLAAAAERRQPVMDALRMAAATVGLEATGDEPEQDCALRLVAALPVMVATYWRLLQGLEVPPLRTDLDHAANFLYMLDGQEPSHGRVRGLETYLNTVVDHGMNASTFTARVITSTHSDLVSAITGAIGALKGPLHGGAPGPALDMVFDIGHIDNAEPIIRAKLERGERLMGFGHRVYKVRDPRAEVLSAAAERLASSGENRELYELATAVEKVAVSLLAESKPGRRLDTNVEFYTALLLHALGLERELFTPTFAIARVVGWTAHCLEQLATGRLIRPRALYAGAVETSWLPLDQRR